MALLPLALAACAQGGGSGPSSIARVAPARAILYDYTLTVEMTDRSLCVGQRGNQGPSWQGTLAGCPHPWPYSTSRPAARVTRLPLASDGPGPAQATVTAPDGRSWTFGTPTAPAG